MRVSELDDRELAAIQALTPSEKGGCYRTAIDPLVNEEFAPVYVLGVAINSADGVPAPHAWMILCDGRQADRLLQKLILLNATRHVTMHELTRAEVVAVVETGHRA